MITDMYAADSTQALRSTLFSHGYRAVELHSVRPFLDKGKATARKTFLLFLQHLKHMGLAGVDLPQAIALYIGRQKPGLFKQQLQALHAKIRMGKVFSLALKEVGLIQDPMVLQLLRTADATGEIQGILDTIITYLSWQQHVQRKRQQLLFYPALVLLMALVTGGFLGFFLMPKLAALQADLQGAEYVAESAQGIPFLWPAMAALFSGGAAWGLWHFRSTPHLLQRMLFALPVLGPLLKHVAWSRFCEQVRVFEQAHMPLLEGISHMQDNEKNPLIHRALSQIHGALLTGTDLKTALDKTKFYPPTMGELLSLLHQRDHSTALLTQLCDYYHQEMIRLMDQAIQRLPLLIMVITGALFIWIILHSFYPLYASFVGEL